ncbi:hypothetical protein SY89_00355 [Halolamina pelagica]|uniref:DUF7344 domain-containing protein n=1 Tax=Halolamina pelagica TaxID=699431 RepID=A0A0P7G8M8_9EURY|nr:transcriptional regulator [Halolamina pelagica]KPN29641.1 hypothetical protein SY89_00355 [Halolamina pelagica]
MVLLHTVAVEIRRHRLWRVSGRLEGVRTNGINQHDRKRVPLEGTKLSEDDVFETLANRRRRFVIHALKHAEEPIGITELSTDVTAWEFGIDREEVTYDDRRNVYSTLKRTHLPKLEEKGIVTVDEEAHLVEPTPALRDLDIYVEVLSSREIPWSLYYVGLAGVAVALLLAISTGTPGFAALDPVGGGVFVSTAFGVSAVAHYFVGRRTRLGSTEKPPELRKRQ